jgi:CheY-like chemotaxis protein
LPFPNPEETLMSIPVRVLIVGGDPLQRMLMEEHMRRIEVEYCAAAANAAEAIEKLRKELFHFVFTDMNMPPGMSGRELVGFIRDDTLLRHLRLVMVTSEDEPELRQFLDRRFVSYIRKDELSKESICRAIRHQLIPR